MTSIGIFPLVFLTGSWATVTLVHSCIKTHYIQWKCFTVQNAHFSTEWVNRVGAAQGSWQKVRKRGLFDRKCRSLEVSRDRLQSVFGAALLGHVLQQSREERTWLQPRSFSKPSTFTSRTTGLLAIVRMFLLKWLSEEKQLVNVALWRHENMLRVQMFFSFFPSPTDLLSHYCT